MILPDQTPEQHIAQLENHPCDCDNLPEIEHQDGIWYIYCLTCLTCYDGITLDDAVEKWIRYNPTIEMETQ